MIRPRSSNGDLTNRHHSPYFVGAACSRTVRLNEERPQTVGAACSRTARLNEERPQTVDAACSRTVLIDEEAVWN